MELCERGSLGMESMCRKARLCLVSAFALLLAACGSGGGTSTGGGGGNQPSTPRMTVTPAANSISGGQSLKVTVAVAGTSGLPTPTGSATLSIGSYTSPAATLSGGSASITVPAGMLAAGANALTATYTPDAASSSTYNAARGTASVSVTVASPTVTVASASNTIGSDQPLSVAVTVTGVSGLSMPTGTVILTSGSYSSLATVLGNSGSATMVIPAGSLLAGSARLTASYTPDAGSSKLYASASGTANIMVTPQVAPTVSVTPSLQSLSTAQPLNVTVKVAGKGSVTPTGTVVLSSGTYTAPATSLSSGSATITIASYSLVYGSDRLSAAYTPDKQGATMYGDATGSATVSVARATPAISVTPASLSIDTTQSLNVAIGLSGPGTGAPAPTGTVKLTGPGYTSSAATVANGSATITIAAGAIAPGSDTLTASYTPDATSSPLYNATTGISAAVTVVVMSTISVTQGTSIGTVSDQLMGMNLAAWYDVAANATNIKNVFATAGIKAIRWPGGSWSDAYHWGEGGGAPTKCKTSPTDGTWPGYDTYPQFVSSIVGPGQYDLALTANYGSNAACTGGGDPVEAAAWAAEAVKDGYPASHMTVGNEEYGTWEFDLHAKPNDPTTYADAVIGATGYYDLIKAASPTTAVGVVVDGGGIQAGWDTTVLSVARGSYDFVEYHFYPQQPGNETDTYLVHQAAQDFTASMVNLRGELSTAGEPSTPIYVGEMGSVSSSPGKQSWSITQGLYAGQMLGEMMNDGIARATWWIGFGNCNESSTGTAQGNMSASLYGWQTFGAYNVFSDGPADGPCGLGSGPIGTMSPTARAFQLFSNITESGANHTEDVLNASVLGDTANIRAYAATNNGGTALFLFNLNENQSERVTITLSQQSVSSSGVKLITYDKALYDQTHAATPVWADPTTIDMGSQNLPLKLTLTPWSMNVVIIK
jgi:hypothetical protein